MCGSFCEGKTDSFLHFQLGVVVHTKADGRGQEAHRIRHGHRNRESGTDAAATAAQNVSGSRLWTAFLVLGKISIAAVAATSPRGLVLSTRSQSCPGDCPN